MTLEEKLAHFKECALQDANKQSESIINECKNDIQKQYDDYAFEANKKYENKLKIESANLLKNKNKQLSKSSTEIRRKANEKAEELKDKLFSDVMKKISAYKKSADYKALLKEMIKNSLEYGSTDELEIYIDKSDKELIKTLEKDCNVSLKLSDTDILGGIRAVCKDKNILIDNSFASRFAEEKSTFTF